MERNLSKPSATYSQYLHAVMNILVLEKRIVAREDEVLSSFLFNLLINPLLVTCSLVWPFQITKQRSNKLSWTSLKKKEKWEGTYTCIIVLESPTSPPSPIVRESYPISKSNSSKLIWMTWRRRSRFNQCSFTDIKDFELILLMEFNYEKKVELRSKNRLFVRFFVSNKNEAFLESARLRWMFNRTITAKDKLKTLSCLKSDVEQN